MYAYWKLYQDEPFVYTTEDMQKAQNDPARMGPVFAGETLAEAIASASKWDGLHEFA